MFNILSLRAWILNTAKRGRLANIEKEKRVGSNIIHTTGYLKYIL